MLNNKFCLYVNDIVCQLIKITDINNSEMIYLKYPKYNIEF